MIPSGFDILWISSPVRQELLLEKNDKTDMLSHHGGEKKTRMLLQLHSSTSVSWSSLPPFWVYQGQRWIKKPVRVSGGDLEQPYLKAAASRMVALVYHLPSAAWNVATVTEELNLKFHFILINLHLNLETESV